MKTLDQYWYSQNILAWLLLPLSWLFRLVSVLRRWMYQTGMLTSTGLAVPTIVVGNISVGGTGKTPLLIALCELLKNSGYRPGVISRGYASALVGEALVSAGSTAAEVGDEPLLIARRTSCPVAVGKKRTAAARLLLEKSDCDIILSDDGLQHYSMQRDLEIAVIDAARMHGNGYYLPAGPLRESVSRLDTVDLVVYGGSDKATYGFELKFLNAVNIATGEVAELKTFLGEPVHAVAGIGHPQRFFDQLAAEKLELLPHAFADHYDYKERDFIFNDERPVLMTEKDAVKCAQMTLKNLWYVPVVARLSPQLIVDFKQGVKRVVANRHTHSK